MTYSVKSIASQAIHAGVSKEEREKIGISDFLVRVSVGIEDSQELIEDFQEALALSSVEKESP